MYNLKNFMEDVVSKEIDSVLNVMNLCKCEKCRLDIMALALNDLPSMYVVTEAGELYSKLNELERQFDVDVQTAIIKAAVFVSKFPKHEKVK